MGDLYVCMCSEELLLIMSRGRLSENVDVKKEKRIYKGGGADTQWCVLSREDGSVEVCDTNVPNVAENIILRLTVDNFCAKLFSSLEFPALYRPVSLSYRSLLEWKWMCG